MNDNIDPRPPRVDEMPHETAARLEAEAAMKPPSDELSDAINDAIAIPSGGVITHDGRTIEVVSWHPGPVTPESAQQGEIRVVIEGIIKIG